MKRTAILISGMVIVGVGLYISYSVGYARGFTSGSKSTYDALGIPPTLPGMTITPPITPKPVQHRYEFQQKGASIFRFDLDNGEACWMQLSEADAHTPIGKCPIFDMSEARPIPDTVPEAKP